MWYIRFEDFMGDEDDLAEVNLIGPFPDRAARGRELQRLDTLPLGRPEFNGGYLFHADNGLRDPRRADRVVTPEIVAGATTIKEFFHLFHGLPDDVEPAEPEVHPGQTAIPL